MKRLNRWDCVGIGALGVFVACLYLLTENPAVSDDSLARALSPNSTQPQVGHEWLGIYLNERKVGFFHLEKTLNEIGLAYAVEGRIEQKGILGEPLTLELDVRAQLDGEMALNRVTFKIEAGPAQFLGRAVVVGRTLKLAIDTGGETREESIPLEGPLVLRETLGPRLAQLDLSPGATREVRLFDPITQRQQTARIEVIGHEQVVVVDRLVDAIRIVQDVNGMRLNAWLNRRGEVMRQELGFGLVAVRETELQARRQSEPVSLVERTMIDVPDLKKTQIEGPRIAFDLGGADLTGFELNVGRQNFADGRLTVTKETAFTGKPLSTKHADDEFLQPSLLIQSDAQPIIDAARRAIGGATDTLTAAKRLMNWVSDTVADVAVIGVPSALETLKAKQGDCNEHTTLFVAMARAIGIPTRFVTGLAYLKGRFAYHAWAEVQVESGWLSVDPTWAQLPADVGHLAFVRGGLGQQAGLLRLMGNLTIEHVSRP